MPTMTFKEMALARKLVNKGIPIDEIVARLNGRHKAGAILRAVERGREREARRGIKYRERKKELRSGAPLPKVLIERPGTIPAHVEADRGRRLSISPRDHTAFIMGDPLPGYSALDRRGTCLT